MGSRASIQPRGPGRPAARVPHPKSPPPSRQRRRRSINSADYELAHQRRLELINRPLPIIDNQRTFGGKIWAGVLISKDDFWTDLCNGRVHSVYVPDEGNLMSDREGRDDTI